MNRSRRCMPTVLALLALGTLGAMEVNTQTSVVKVLECLRANSPASLVIAEVEVEVQGPGVRTPKLGARLYARRENKHLQAMLVITAPADLAGTRYLSLESGPEDQLYLYAPAIGKVRRVSGYGTEADIGGTTITPADLRVMLQAVRGASATLAAPVTVGGRVTDTLRFVPTLIDSPYRRIIASVDRDTCAVVQTEFHSPDGATVKQYRADPASLVRSGRHWYASVGTIEDYERGSKARVALRGVRTDQKLPSRYFDPRSFHKGD